MIHAMLKRYALYCYLVLIATVLLSTNSISFGQDVTAQEKGYVKMKIGAMGLHCPFLGVTLKEQLKADTAYSELKFDKSDQFLTFAYTKDLKYTEKYFQDIAVRVGYPAEIVTITLHDSQPAIEVHKQ